MILRSIEQVLQQAQQRSEVKHHDLSLIAGGILGMIEGLYAIPDYVVERDQRSLANELIDAMLHGIRKP